MKTITIDDNHCILDLMKYIMNKLDPDGKHFFAGTAEEGLEIIEKEDIRIVFLDIEMPDMSGEDAARLLNEKYGKVDLIFITGHSEYALLGHQLHCAAFVTKPFGEEDIEEALEYLRLPIENKSLKVRCSGHFSAAIDGKPLKFERGRTEELLAYLVYRNGSFATNGELIGVLWDGDPEKQDLLRKHIKDLRDSFDLVGVGDLLIKKRGSICLDMDEIDLKGEPSCILDEFGWNI